MSASLGRTVAVFTAWLVVLLGLIYVEFGIEWGATTPVLEYFVIAVAAAIVLFGLELNWRRRVAGTLGSVALIYFVFGFSPGTGILNVVAVAALAAFMAGWRLDWPRPIAGALVVLGLIVFAYGINLGGGVSGNSLGYPPHAEYGMTYDWEANQIHYGDHTETIHYRSSSTPNRAAVVLGYLLTAVGTVGIFDDEAEQSE